MVIKQGSCGPTWAEVAAARNKREDESVLRRVSRGIMERDYYQERER